MNGCIIFFFQHLSVSDQELDVGQAIEILDVPSTSSSQPPQIEHHYDQLRNDPKNPYSIIEELRKEVEKLKARDAKNNR